MVRILILTTALLCAACGPAERNYRNVPEPVWGQLSPEQKQLIVDKSFEDELGE